MENLQQMDFCDQSRDYAFEVSRVQRAFTEKRQTAQD
jgi:hypothetical protein